MASRRLFLLACGGGLLGAGAGLAAEAPAQAPVPPAGQANVPAKAKVSQAAARYQDHPQDVRSCASCTLFLSPDGCKSVEGKISPDGFCLLFDLAD